ncbi:MAG: MFS transporter [Rhizobiaceae bacterium]
MPTDPSPHLGGLRAWLIWSLAALSFGYAFFQRVAPSVMVTELMADFAIGGGMLGVLSALYFYPYVLLQIPLGALIDKLGARALLVGALSVAGVGSLIFGMAEQLSVAYLGRILIGVGSGVGFLASLALASKWFPPNRFAMLAGLTMFFGMMSGILAQAPLALFVQKFGWRASQWNLGAFGLGLALLIFLFVRNSPEERAAKTSKQDWGSIWSALGKAARTLEVWKIALVASAMTGPMLTLGGLWGTPFVMEAYGLERPYAAFLVSLMLLGWAFGAPFSGWLSDRLQRRRPLLIVGSGVIMIALACIIFLPNLSLYTVIAILVIAGMAGGVMAVCFAQVRAVIPSEFSGAALGIVNGMTVASGAVLQPLVGAMLDYQWSGKMAAGSRVYAASDYTTAFLLILFVAGIGFLTSLRLRDQTV